MPSARKHRLLTLALFVALAVAHTWPLALAPGRLSRNDNADTVLHEWTLAWVAHQLPRDPVHLFDGNIFYPERDTLAFSDHLFVQSLMAAPLLWAGESPVVAFNLVLIAGFALTGWTTSLVITRWTGSRLAGVLSGSLMAFNALTLTRLPQLQDQHLEFFPLALLALDQLLERPGLGRGLALAGWYVLEALTCGYVLVFAFLSLLTGGLVRASEWVGPRFTAIWRPVLAATAVVSVALMPFLLPYARVSRTEGLIRSFDEIALYSARPADYLSTGGRFHFALWSNRFFVADALFPGVLAAALVVVAIATGTAVRDRRARMALAFGIVAFVLSFGTKVPVYQLLYYGFPLMRGLRGAVRFGQFFLVGVAMLAGFGLADLQRRLRPGAILVPLLFVAGVNLEALRAPFVFREYTGIPAIYQSLATPKRAVVAFFPFYDHASFFGNARYMLYSTVFWRPLVNGYSGFAPPSYYERVERLVGFPDRTSIDYMRSLGVTHVVVDAGALSGPRLAQLPTVPELSLWRTEGTISIYELR